MNNFFREVIKIIVPYIRLVLTGILVIIIIWILIRFRASKQPRKGSLDILKKRAERGEITKKAYEDARRKQKK